MLIVWGSFKVHKRYWRGKYFRSPSTIPIYTLSVRSRFVYVSSLLKNPTIWAFFLSERPVLGWPRFSGHLILILYSDAKFWIIPDFLFGLWEWMVVSLFYWICSGKEVELSGLADTSVKELLENWVERLLESLECFLRKPFVLVSV